MTVADEGVKISLRALSRPRENGAVGHSGRRVERLGRLLAVRGDGSARRRDALDVRQHVDAEPGGVGVREQKHALSAVHERGHSAGGVAHAAHHRRQRAAAGRPVPLQAPPHAQQLPGGGVVHGRRRHRHAAAGAPLPRALAPRRAHAQPLPVALLRRHRPRQRLPLRQGGHRRRQVHLAGTTTQVNVNSNIIFHYFSYFLAHSNYYSFIKLVSK